MENNKYLVPTNISIENLPCIITSTISDISNVDKKIKNAVSKAEEAKQSAEVASRKKAGWSLLGGDKKDAIEALQTAAVNQANALTDTVDANKELFENQKKMTQAIRYLFGLGVANIAANRTVVRELELKLKNASEEELSELARQELTNVILQLRAQEDMQNRIEGHDKLFQEHKSRLDFMDNSISTFKDECSGKLEEMKQVLDASTEELKKASDILAERQDAFISKSQQEIASALENLDTKQKENSEALRKEQAVKLLEMKHALDASAEELKKDSTALKEKQDAFITKSLQEIASAHEDFGKKQKDAFELLRRDNEEQLSTMRKQHTKDENRINQIIDQNTKSEQAFINEQTTLMATLKKQMMIYKIISVCAIGASIATIIYTVLT